MSDGVAALQFDLTKSTKQVLIAFLLFCYIFYIPLTVSKHTDPMNIKIIARISEIDIGKRRCCLA